MRIKTNPRAAAAALRAFELQLASLAAGLQREHPDAQIVVELREGGESDQDAGGAVIGGATAGEATIGATAGGSKP